jgi:hypothetical protein
MAAGFLFSAGRADCSRDSDFPVLIRATFLERRFWPTDRRIGKKILNFRVARTSTAFALAKPGPGCR